MTPARLTLLAFSTVALAAACNSPRTTPAPSPAPTQAAQAASAPGQPGPGGAPRRPRLTPLQQDSARQVVLGALRQRVAGHESERAGSYFKNVQVLKDLTVAEFLRTMDEQYGRGLGWGCANCHNMQDLSDDSRKNKKIARQMQQMQVDINGRQMAGIKELDADFRKVSCVTCHRGSNEPPSTMGVPGTTPAPAAAR